MSTSSLPKDYSITSSDTITLNSNYSGSTITIDPSYNYTYSTGISTTGYNTMCGGAGSYTIPTLTTSQINAISGQGISSISIDTSTFRINLPEEWVNCLPDFDRIEKMCKLYPGLAIAFEKFKTTYKLVKDDYDTPADQRPRP